MSRVIGIDLGTTSSRVAVMQGNSPIIIENREGEGTTPSYVAFLPSGQLLVGNAARRQAITNHESTVYAVKRLIGRRYDDPTIEPMKRILPYRIIRGHNGDAWIEIRGRPYSPVEITSIILRNLKETAEAYLETPVTQAVVTVPAYFDDAQRQATKDAGRIAGIEVLRTISEPTAAALTFGYRNKSDNTRMVAVYDLGGGTFDVSILTMGDGVFEVHSTYGDTFLGGEDFDICIVDHLIAMLEVEGNFDPSRDRLALQRLKDAAEQAKIDLSSSAVAQISLPFLSANQFGAVHLNTKIKRDVFEKLIGTLVDKTITICAGALKDGRVTGNGVKQDIELSEIDDVILVGGSTRIPLVEAAICRFFQRQPYRGPRREDAVALGAAIQAGVLQGNVKDVLLLDVTPFSLGIETLGGTFTPLIARNVTIPTRREQIFSTAEDNQSAVTISVFQGEHELAAENKLIGRFDFVGIPPAPRGIPQIEVTFDIDANGVVQVFAKDKRTGKEQEIRLQSFGGLSEEEIRVALESRSHPIAPSLLNSDQHDRLSVEQSVAPQATQFVRTRPNLPKRYFVSYAHEDHYWVTRIEKSVSILTGENSIALWVDRAENKTGVLWEENILNAIDSADAAIILVSEDLLASKFIQTKELPRLFARREQIGIQMMPIIVRFCPYTLSRDLAQFQAFNDPDRPWSSLQPWEVDRELARLALEISKTLE